MNGHPLALRLYVGVLAAILVAVLAFAPLSLDLDVGDLGGWIGLTLLFAATEAAFTSIYDDKARFGLSASEAVLLPMLLGLPFAELVWSVTLGGLIVRVLQRREGLLKGLFNVASFGCAAAGAAWLYNALTSPSTGLSASGLAAGVEAVVLYALLTHVFASGISIAFGRPFLELTRSLGAATAWNIAGSIALGVLFGAAYVEHHWTVAMFPLPLAALFLGYRAILRQRLETERVEHLHAASRALAAGPDLDSSIHGFLDSVADVASAAEARFAVRDAGGWALYVSRDLDPGAADEGSQRALLDVMASAPIVLNEDSEDKDALQLLGVHSLVAVPVDSGGARVGCLLALDRVGAGEFGEPELRLLETLATDLRLTLDSHRLFEQVVEERERFGRIFEGSTEGICLLDSSGVVAAWNPALESITGYKQRDVLGRVWSDLVMIRDKTQQRLTGAELIATHPDMELEVVTREGPAHWISVMSGSVAAGDHDVYVVLVRDRSAERAAEEAKSDFLSTISHELRTPLTTIKGALQMLGRTEELPPPVQQQMVTLMRRGSDRLERLVMNLLFVSQIESSGEVPIFNDEFVLESMVREKVAAVLSGEVDVTIDTPDGDVEVRADRERLGHVIEHLLENARKFGGNAPVIVEITRDNGFGVISVVDQGPGVSRADQERIFDRFTRLGQVLTRETQGAGVGLFIAKRSIDAMGGRIWVESELGRGARFSIAVPLARPMIVSNDATA